MILVNVKYALVTMQGRWAVGCLFVSMERSHKVRARNLLCKTSLTSMLCEWTFTIMSHRQTMRRRKPKRTCCHLQICSRLRCTTVSIVHIPKLLVMCIYTYIIIYTGRWFQTFFPYIGNNHPNRLSYLSEGLKPPTSSYMYIRSEFVIWHIHQIIGPLETPFSQVQIPDLGRDVFRTHCSFSCDAGSFTGAKQDRLFFRTAGCSFRRTVDVGCRRQAFEATTCSQQVAKHWVEGRPTFMTFLPFEIHLWGSPKDENVFPGC